MISQHLVISRQGFDIIIFLLFGWPVWKQDWNPRARITWLLDLTICRTPQKKLIWLLGALKDSHCDQDELLVQTATSSMKEAIWLCLVFSYACTRSLIETWHWALTIFCIIPIDSKSWNSPNSECLVQK